MPTHLLARLGLRQSAYLYLGLEQNLLNLIQAHRVAGSVVEFGGSGGFVRSDALGVFQRAAVLQIDRYSRSPERVAADVVRQSGRYRPAFYHSQSV